MHVRQVRSFPTSSTPPSAPASTGPGRSSAASTAAGPPKCTRSTCPSPATFPATTKRSFPWPLRWKGCGRLPRRVPGRLRSSCVRRLWPMRRRREAYMCPSPAEQLPSEPGVAETLLQAEVSRGLESPEPPVGGEPLPLRFPLLQYSDCRPRCSRARSALPKAL